MGLVGKSGSNDTRVRTGGTKDSKIQKSPGLERKQKIIQALKAARLNKVRKCEHTSDVCAFFRRGGAYVYMRRG